MKTSGHHINALSPPILLLIPVDWHILWVETINQMIYHKEMWSRSIIVACPWSSRDMKGDVRTCKTHGVPHVFVLDIFPLPMPRSAWLMPLFFWSERGKPSRKNREFSCAPPLITRGIQRLTVSEQAGTMRIIPRSTNHLVMVNLHWDSNFLRFKIILVNKHWSRLTMLTRSTMLLVWVY